MRNQEKNGLFHKMHEYGVGTPHIEKETGTVSLKAILRKIFNKDNE